MHDAAALAIRHELRVENPGAVVLLSGPWGCGKTHLWRRVVDEGFAGQSMDVSLFGLSSIEGVKRALMKLALLQVADTVKEKKFERLGRAIKKIGAASAMTIAKVAANSIGTDILNGIVDAADVVPDEALICFDDVDRAAPELDLVAFLGFVNFLAESRRARVIIIIDEERLEQLHGEDGERMQLMMERVVDRHLKVTATPQELYAGFAERWKTDPDILAFLLEKRQVVEKVMAADSQQNLRTLQRILASLADLRAILGIDPPPAAVPLLAALTVEKAEGRLKERGVYEGAQLSALGQMFDLPEEKDKNPEGRAFYRKYFLDVAETFGFYASIFDAVDRGYFDDAATRADLLPQTEKKTRAQALLSQTNTIRWILNGDDENTRWIDDAVDIINGVTEHLSAAETLALYLHAAGAAERSALPPIEPRIEERIRQRLKERALALDETIDRSFTFHFSERTALLDRFLPDYERDLLAARSDRLSAELADSVAKKDSSKFVSLVRTGDGMQTFLRRNLDALRALATVDPPEHVHFLQLITDLMEERSASSAVLCDDLIKHMKATASSGATSSSHRWLIERMLRRLERHFHASARGAGAVARGESG